MPRLLSSLLLFFFAFAADAQSDSVVLFPDSFPAGFFVLPNKTFARFQSARPNDSTLVRELRKAMHESGFDTLGISAPIKSFYDPESQRSIPVNVANYTYRLDINGDKEEDLVYSFHLESPISIVFIRHAGKYTEAQIFGGFLTAIDYSKGKLQRVTSLSWDCCTYGYNTYYSSTYDGKKFSGNLSIRIPSAIYQSMPDLHRQFTCTAKKGALLRPFKKKLEGEPKRVSNGTTFLPENDQLAVYQEQLLDDQHWYLALSHAGKRFTMGWICEDEISKP